ncbi:MAG: hypothetical protein JWM31_2304 [Solirubrobacterales bacterium]|nr:hypothetical protein [Solirubrobacterales bacterium]
MTATRHVREHRRMRTSFTLLHRDGTTSANPPLDDVLRLLGELRDGTGTVAVLHSTGWLLRIHGDGVVEFGNEAREDVAVRHAAGLRPLALAELAEAVAVGSFYETLEHEWQDGPRPGPVRQRA